MQQIESELKSPSIEYRPEQRWWLASGLHTDETLRNEIATAQKLGFGGMEFLAMPEDNIDNARYAWGSEEWVHDSMIVTQETTDRGMSVSYTSGTNWANANLNNITPEDVAAAKELDFVYEELKGGESRKGKMPEVDLPALLHKSGSFGHKAPVKEQYLVAVLATKVVGESNGVPVLDENVTDLTDKVSGNELQWTAPEGKWRVMYFYSHGTGQTAEPSCSVNYTVNYLDPEGAQAVIDYWRDTVLTPELKAIIAKNPRAQMYMDSLELVATGEGGLFWGHCFEAEFKRRRGYSVRPYLPFLVRVVPSFSCTTRYHYEPTSEAAATISKVRFDLVHTYTDLYIDHMLKPFGEFLHENDILLRAEISYGLPFELTRPGPYVDGVETESLEFASQIDAYRLLGGAAHLFGKQYSSETGATTRNAMLPHRFYDQIINTQLAAGITKTVLHGWASTSGAPGTEWPGHEGMYYWWSERFDYRQPGSEFYPLWSDALARKQFLLRQGNPRIDVGILRTDHFTDNALGYTFKDKEGYRNPEDVVYGTWYMRNRENFWWEDMAMQDAGWSYEFFDGSLLMRDDVHLEGKLVQPKGPGYQALIVYQSTLVSRPLPFRARNMLICQDADVAKHLLKWAKEGLPILFVHNTRETLFRAEEKYWHYPKAAASTPGLDHRDDELADTVKQLLSLPNVKEVNKQDQTLSALRSLKVTGRAEFVESNENVLSHLREDGQRSHLFLYHYQYETGKTTEVQVALQGQGVAYRLNDQTGSLAVISDTQVKDGRTIVKVKLVPGESTVITFDRSSKPTQGSKNAQPTKVAELPKWDLTVESWDAGETKIIKEDRGLGYTTEEHQPQTKVTPISVGETTLKPWKDISAVGPEVSGVGSYKTSFNLNEKDGSSYLLNLGSTGGALGSVTINGSPALGFDTSVATVDISKYVKQGENKLEVRVGSSLNNRLMARGYYERPEPAKRDRLGKWRVGKNGKADGLEIRDYGLMGPVVVLKQ